MKNFDLKKYIFSSIWLIFEFFFKITMTFILAIILARYLGPKSFGLLNYSLSLVGCFLILSRLGIEYTLVRDTAKYPNKSNEYMITAFGLIVITSILALFLLNFLLFFFESDSNVKFYTAIVSLGLLFQCFQVIDYSFQGHGLSKYSSLAKLFSYGLSILLKVYLVLNNADLSLIVLSYLLDPIILSVSLLITHIAVKNSINIKYFQKNLVKPILKSSWPLVITALSIQLCLLIDQIMIKTLLGSHELGIYSAATRLYQGWIFFSYIFASSLIPIITKFKQYNRNIYVKFLSILFGSVFWFGIILSLFVNFFADSIVLITFGSAFIDSVVILKVLIFTAPFTILGSMISRYLMIENMEKKILFMTFIGLCLNFVFNTILIPIYGPVGGAISTFISIFVGHFLILFFISNLKFIQEIVLKGILIRYHNHSNNNIHS